MSDKKITANFPICGLLGVAFIVLKLCKVISWNWLWVLSPFWVPVALGIVILVIYLIYQIIKEVIPDMIVNRKILNNSWLKEEAEKHKAEWHAGIPEINRPLSFFVNKKWHNGRYVDGKFKIIGSDTYFETAEVWYYK